MAKMVGGTQVTVRFTIADGDAERAARYLQDRIEGMLQRSAGVVCAPEIVAVERDSWEVRR